MAATALEFGVLGPLQMSVGGTPVPLGAPKQRAVLAMLVINRNRPVSVDALIDAAWEDHPPPEARAGLRAYLSNIRRLLNGAGADAHVTLATVPPGYRLAVADEACDLGRFIIEKTAGVRAAASSQFEQASEHLSAALSQWRGPVVEDLRDFQFVQPFAAALLEDKLLTQTVRAEVEIACGRWSSVIGELETLTQQHPYREPLWVQLITAYYLGERQSDALDAYRRLKVALADDLGIDPGPTLRDLHDRILRQQPLDVKHAAKTTATGIVTLLDLRTAAPGSAPARLRKTSGQSYPLTAPATRVGRLIDNEIILNDPNVSRHHAIVIDTGTNFVINDLRSANGVQVNGRRIRGSAVLADSDHIRICAHEFVFEIQPGDTDDAGPP